MNQIHPRGPRAPHRNTLAAQRQRLLAPAALAALVCALSSGMTAPPAGAAPTTTTTYPASSAPVANPGRGFYRQQGECDRDPFVPATLVRYRTERKTTLVMCIFYLTDFKASPVSWQALDFFRQQADAVRAAGAKMIVRFAYTRSAAGDDATPQQVQAHLAQLAPYLRSSSDVIAVVQSGFVGAYGEGYYTQHFGDAGHVGSADWANRKAVVDTLLRILPSSVGVQVRTPAMKRVMYGKAPTSTGDVTARSPVSRVGHHNDCFLSSDSDAGTYGADVAGEKAYLAADTGHVLMGGETCGRTTNPPRSDCPTALAELGRFHYTYLNEDWSPAVLRSWAEQGCLPEVERRLGYRLTLVSTTSATSVTRGTALPFSMVVRNDGWSSTPGPRSVHLVLRSTTAPQAPPISLSLTSTRNMTPGRSLTVHRDLLVPAATPPGTYDVLLALPDPAAALARRPEYAVQLANTGLWESRTGLNRLQRTVVVR